MNNKQLRCLMAAILTTVYESPEEAVSQADAIIERVYGKRSGG